MSGMRENRLRASQIRDIRLLSVKGIISCLEFCGRQSIALRGHRDDACSE